MILLLSPKNRTTVSLTNDEARLMREVYEQTPEAYRAGECWCLIKAPGIECSSPRPVHFAWCRGTMHDFRQMNCTLHISKTKDFHEERTVAVPHACGCTVFNLEVGKTYYWYVETDDFEKTKSEVFVLRTARELPRAIRLEEHISNVRDIGGALTADGFCVRQGLFYRGAALGGAPWTTKFSDVFSKELSIRTEIDLCGSDEEQTMTQVTPAEALDFVNFPIVQYEGILYEGQDQIYGRLFHYLSQPEHYPVYVHCAVGYDRTGTVSALLQYLLGVSENDIYWEYIYSALASQEWNDRGRERIDYLLEVLCEKTGETDHYRAVEKFLLSTDAFDENDLERLRRLYLEAPEDMT